MKRILNTVIGVSFLFYLFALVVLLFFISRRYWAEMPLLEYIKRSSNFVPFKTINAYIMAISNGSMNLIIPIKNLAGNKIAFLPMGLYLPFFLRKLTKFPAFAIAITVMILSVEIVQVITRRGSLDIDDFILNFIGAVMGFGIWKTANVLKLYGKKPNSSINNS